MKGSCLPLDNGTMSMYNKNDNGSIEYIWSTQRFVPDKHHVPRLKAILHKDVSEMA